MPSGQALRNIPDRDVAPPDVHFTESFTVNNVTFRQNLPLHVFQMEDIAYRDDFDLFYVTTHAPDPKTWKQAMESKFATEWIAARLSEQNSFKEHGVLTIVPREEARTAYSSTQGSVQDQAKPPYPGVSWRIGGEVEVPSHYPSIYTQAASRYRLCRKARSTSPLGISEDYVRPSCTS